jgi:AcrR family transcriptional regulator
MNASPSTARIDEEVPPPADFRARAAGRRRERMRERLLDAVLAIYAADGRGERAVVDDLVQAAGVSRGTFYKYFNTLAEAVAEVGRRDADDALRAYVQIFEPETDPLVKVAGGPLLGLARAGFDPRRAAFTGRVDFAQVLDVPPPLYAVVGLNLEAARAAGVVRFSSLRAATDTVLGVTVQGVRRFARGGAFDEAYLHEVATMILQGLGAERPAAEAAVRLAWSRVRSQADRLPWWRPSAD